MKAARSPRQNWTDASGPGNGRKREMIAKGNLKSCSRKTVPRPKAGGGILGLARSSTFPLACTAARISSSDCRRLLTMSHRDGFLTRRAECQPEHLRNIDIAILSAYNDILGPWWGRVAHTAWCHSSRVERKNVTSWEGGHMPTNTVKGKILLYADTPPPRHFFRQVPLHPQRRLRLLSLA